MANQVKNKKTALYNSINKRQLQKQDKSPDYISYILFTLAITLSMLIGSFITASYFTGQPLDDTITTVIVDGKTVVFGTDNHTRLTGDTIGRAKQGGNIMWIEAFRGEKNIEETCNHELLHLYGVPGDDTIEHEAIEIIDREMETSFCNKALEKANQKSKLNLTQYRP